MITVILLIFATLREAAACKVTSCRNGHTDYFKANWRNNPQDFWQDVPIESHLKCQEISNEDLRKEYPGLFPTGWQVEHIIELNNDYPNYADCKPLNIRANMVSAVGAWKVAVGQLCCLWADKEKSIVYGARYGDALNMVTSRCCAPRTWSVAIVCAVLALIFGIGVILYILYLRSGNQTRDTVLPMYEVANY